MEQRAKAGHSMIGQTIILRSPASREGAKRLIDLAPHGAVLNVRPATRTNEQNALMWALLSEISRAKPEGRELVPEVWKSLFLHALGHSQRFEMALDGRGVVPVGFRSSRLTKEQMSDLIETIREYGARHGVTFQDAEPQTRAA
jgi:hypothetical protein